MLSWEFKLADGLLLQVIARATPASTKSITNQGNQENAVNQDWTHFIGQRIDSTKTHKAMIIRTRAYRQISSQSLS